MIETWTEASIQKFKQEYWSTHWYPCANSVRDFLESSPSVLVTNQDIITTLSSATINETVISDKL